MNLENSTFQGGRDERNKQGLSSNKNKNKGVNAKVWG